MSDANPGLGLFHWEWLQSFRTGHVPGEKPSELSGPNRELPPDASPKERVRFGRGIQELV